MTGKPGVVDASKEARKIAFSAYVAYRLLAAHQWGSFLMDLRELGIVVDPSVLVHRFEPQAQDVLPPEVTP